MRGLVLGLTVLMMTWTSQASTNQFGNETFGKPIVIETQVRTAIKKEQALVKSSRIPKPKLFRSNPYRIVHYSLMDDQDDVFVNDEDIYTGYRREDLIKIKSEPTKDDPDGDITEEIRWKLFLARTAAMIRYHQIHG